ncbi:MAG: glycoside hydrolase family 3 C-terminal domain-containing protein [Ruminococcus sp.]|nr:glycoside hydrolase family 3 C-terminal domain-containing protein [Ruminococcus sp.]
MKNDKFYERAKALTAKLTEEEKLGLLTTHHEEIKRLSIPEFYIGTEVARGYVGREKEKVSTVFPQPVGLAATFDRELMGRLGVIAGDEARAYFNSGDKGGLCLWGPTVDMVRDPRWGRTEEAYGEDVFLAGELTAAYTAGLASQNDDGYVKTVPTLKHFCANNNEEDRGSCSAFLTPRLKREYYYAAFENAIRYGGAKSIMAAYNELNGVPAVMNTDIQDILKHEWGLWFVVSDGGDFSQNVISHRYTLTHSEAYMLCIKAGSDTMTDEDSLVRSAAKKALSDELITWGDIDRVVTNVLYARLRLGLFDKTVFDDITADIIDIDESKRTDLRAACEQVVLLKNNGILPLKGDVKRIAVVGALHNDCLMDWYTGYSSYESTVLDGVKRHFDCDIISDSLWDIVAVKAPNGKYLCAYENGEVRADADKPEDGALFELQDWGENWKDLFNVRYQRYVRLFDDGSIRLHNRRIFDWFTRETFNFKEYLGKTLIEEFLFHGRLTADSDGRLSVDKSRNVCSDMLFEVEVINSGLDRAEKIAKQADAVIYCTGNYPTQTAKECYDRKTLSLNVQSGMTEHICRANKNTVLILVSSYPYAIVNESAAAAAVIHTSHAGAELGEAIALTLKGDNNPSGHTPLTWYRSELDLPDIMDYDIESGGSTYMYFNGEPLYPFGHGLSYSSFKISDMTASQTADEIMTKLSVTNDSDIAGTAVIQLYFTVKDSGVTRPIKKLCGFERAELAAHETKTVQIFTPLHILKIFDVRSEIMLLEDAQYTFFAGLSSSDKRCELTLHINGEKIDNRPMRFKANMFDRIEGARLYYSKREASEYVRSDSWSGKVTYTGLSLTKAQSITIRAGSIIGSRTLSAYIGDNTYNIDISPSDSFDDFDTYTFKISPTDSDSITFNLPQYVSLYDISIE